MNDAHNDQVLESSADMDTNSSESGTVERLFDPITPEEVGYMDEQTFILRVRQATVPREGTSGTREKQCRAILDKIQEGMDKIEQEMVQEGSSHYRTSSEMHHLRIHVTRAMSEFHERCGADQSVGMYEEYCTVSIPSLMDLLRSVSRAYASLKLDIMARNVLLREKLTNANWTSFIFFPLSDVRSASRRVIEGKVTQALDREYPYMRPTVPYFNFAPERVVQVGGDRTSGLVDNSERPGVLGSIIEDPVPLSEARFTPKSFLFPPDSEDTLRRYIRYIQHVLRNTLKVGEDVLDIRLAIPSDRVWDTAAPHSPDGMFRDLGPCTLTYQDARYALRINTPRMIQVHISVSWNSLSPVHFYFMHVILRVARTLQRYQICASWKK